MFTTTVGRRAIRRHGRKVPGMSPSPQPAQPRKNAKSSDSETGRARGVDFEPLVDQAYRDRAVGATACPTTADLDPRQLLRYAAGRADEDELLAVEEFVSRSRWGEERVVALVRGNRPGAPPGLASAIARRLLGGPGNPVLETVARAVLELEDGGMDAGTKNLQEVLKKASGPKTRAACLIGLGRIDEARKTLDASRKELSKDATHRLLDRVSSAAQGSRKSATDDATDDGALLALLDLLPSLGGESEQKKK
jgi:hypothetical protein